jgi:hypothetical protein
MESISQADKMIATAQKPIVASPFPVGPQRRGMLIFAYIILFYIRNEPSATPKQLAKQGSSSLSSGSGKNR